MSTFHRFLCLALALLMLLPFAVACKKEDDTVELGREYRIIYPNRASAELEKTAAEKLCKAMESATGTKPVVDSDWIDASTSTLEIVIGQTNRPESEKAAEGLRNKDFIIRYENERVVILGGNAVATATAVDYFIEHCVNADKKAVYVSTADCLVPYGYMLGMVKVGEVPITDYTLIYPENADLITKYIAYNISDYFLTNAGYELKIDSDKAAPTKYEILIGNTNRPESNEGRYMSPFNSYTYYIAQDGDKIVLQGDSYMIGAAAGALVNDYIIPTGINEDVKLQPITGGAKTHTFKKATSAILMIGDGMGFNHIKAAEDIGLKDFVASRLPAASAVTYSQSVANGDAEFTDSAAAATALATGYKTLNGYVGVDSSGTTRQNVRELAHALGAKTAVVTTDAITGATPSGFLAHSSSRNSTADLLKQINALRSSGGVTYAEGGFKEKELTTYVRTALEAISGNNGRFFAMIEEAHIDKHSHKNDLASARLAVQYYNDAIAYVIGFTMMHPETALIITADHETGKLYADTDGGPLKYHSDDHSNVDVPLYAIGDGTAELLAGGKVNNIDIAKFMAAIFGAESFGQ